MHGRRSWRITVVPRRWGELHLEGVLLTMFDSRLNLSKQVKGEAEEFRLAAGLLTDRRENALLGQAFVVRRLARFDEAIDQLEYIMSIPGDMSAWELRLDPAWDALRSDPRFQMLTVVE